MKTKNNVLVLGGGAVGLCAAYYLSREGTSVTVVDQGEMGHGSSLHNAGYISPSHFIPLASPGLFIQAMKWMVDPRSPFYVKPRLSLDLLLWGYKFWRSSNDQIARRAMPVLKSLLHDSALLTEELARVPGLDFELTKKGLCMLYRSEKSHHACEHEDELARELGVESRLLDRKGLATLDPAIDFRAEGGLFFPGDAHVFPAAFVQTMAAHLEKSGVRMLRNCAVKGFERSDGKIGGAITDRGPIQADTIVLAGGAWLPGILRTVGIRMLLQAGKGYSITLKDPPVKPSLPYILMERRVAVTPFAKSLRFAGTMEIAGTTLSITQPRVEAILDAVPVYFGNVARPQSTDGEVWAGLRPVSPDGMPYIGRMKKYPNLIAATGHAMVGMSLCAVTGKLVAEMAAGKTPSHDLTLVDPNRFD
jgi:D-amino-acid dehydrogenase